MISELIVPLNLQTAKLNILFSYYFYKEDNQGFVLRYNEEGYLFSAFLYNKSEEEKYGLISPLSNKRSKKNKDYPNRWIEESLSGDCSQFHYVLNKLIKTLPNLTIKKIGSLFTIELSELSLQDEDLNTLLLRAYLIAKYGMIVDYYIEEIEYNEELHELKYPYADYQVFPIVGSMHDRYGDEDEV